MLREVGAVFFASALELDICLTFRVTHLNGIPKKKKMKEVARRKVARP